MEGEETRYFCHDFDWNDHKVEVENDASLQYHLLPFQESAQAGPLPSLASPSSSSPSSTNGSSEAWKRFHNRHSMGKFFKERRYLLKEFSELVTAGDYSKVLEVGCGNGSSVLPILRAKTKIIVYACDCSMLALQRARDVVESSDDISDDNQFHPFWCDFSLNGFPGWLMYGSCLEDDHMKQSVLFTGNMGSSRLCTSRFQESEECERSNAVERVCRNESECCVGGVDFVTLVFTLSSIPFQRMPFVIKECFSALKTGGLLFFRDYGLYDMTMLRFLLVQRVGYRAYMRADVGVGVLLCQIAKPAKWQGHAKSLDSWKVSEASLSGKFRIWGRTEMCVTC